MRALAAFALLFFTACTGGGSSGAMQPEGCPTPASSCPTSPPGYAAAVAPIVATRCHPCHAPGGVEASVPLVTYDDVSSKASDVYQQLVTCRMPNPSGGTTMTDEERTTFEAWIVCGAKND